MAYITPSPACIYFSLQSSTVTIKNYKIYTPRNADHISPHFHDPGPRHRQRPPDRPPPLGSQTLQQHHCRRPRRRLYLPGARVPPTSPRQNMRMDRSQQRFLSVLGNRRGRTTALHQPRFRGSLYFIQQHWLLRRYGCPLSSWPRNKVKSPLPWFWMHSKKASGMMLIQSRYIRCPGIVSTGEPSWFGSMKCYRTTWEWVA